MARALNMFGAPAVFRGTNVRDMPSQHDSRTEAALYWAAVSLIVCEGLSIEKAADRLGVEGEELTHILHRRQCLHPATWPDATPEPPSVRTKPH